MKTRYAVLIVAVLMLGILGATASRSAEEAWIGFQKKYAQLSRERTKDVEVQPIEVKQDRFTMGEDRIDRCRTCHIAVDDPRFTKDAQPLHTHPSIAPHQFSEMGCTVCHEGDGRATTEHYAHGHDHFWPEPLLKGKYIESSCARCHAPPYLADSPQAAQTAHLRRGREVFQKNACAGCHRILGFTRGSLGIELTDVGTKRNIEFIQKKIKDPLFNVAATLMPKLALSDDDIQDLSIFLKSLRGRSLAEDPVSYRNRIKKWNGEAPPVVAVSADEGKRLFEAKGCIGCHKLGQTDGKAGPELTFEGQLRDAAYVEAHLVAPRQHTPGSNMPTFWTSATERKAIAAYLTSLGGYTAPADPKEQYAALCSRCHGEKGAGDGPVGKAILPKPRMFTNAQFFNWLPEARADQAITKGVPGTAMPPFGRVLTEDQAKALFAWIRKNFLGEARQEPAKPRQIPEKNPVAYSKESVARGKAVFMERCMGCHGRIADGKGPNAAEMLPRPRNLTNHLFFAELKDSRLFESITYGIVGTGMPPWDVLPESERWDLVNYVRHLSSTGPAALEREREKR